MTLTQSDTAAVAVAPAAGWPSGELAAAGLSDNRVTLTWTDGLNRTIAAIWLRDNCPCPTCRVGQTGEHRYFLGATDRMPTALSANVELGRLHVDFSDGHSSWFSARDFATLTSIASRANPGPRLWGECFIPERFDRDAVLGNDDELIRLLRTAWRDGMALVDGMPNESGECARFLDAMRVPVRDTPFDRVHDVYFHADGYNVAHTDEPLPPHNDFASYQWPPSGQLIHMLVNQVDGGDWINVDGFKVLDDLRHAHSDAFDTLCRVPMAFREHSPSAESWTRAPLARVDSRGNISGIRFSNQLMQPMDPTSPDVDAFYEAYGLLARAINDPANQIRFRGDAGTMQFLHAHRILHARSGFDGTSGSRHLQDTYFDFDDANSLADLLSREAR